MRQGFPLQRTFAAPLRELAQLRPQIVPWSTLCRADWIVMISPYHAQLAATLLLSPLLLALRSRADSVAHISKFFRPFKEPPFSALPLFIRSRWIKKPVQLRRSQVESRRSSFLGSRLDWLRYCERLLEKTANGCRTGQLSILTRNPSIQSRKLGRL